MLGKFTEEDEEKFEQFIKTYGTALKLGAVEDEKNREKLAGLARFYTNQRNHTTLDQVCIVHNMF